MKIAIRAKTREAQVAGSPYIIGEFGISAPVKNRFEGIKDFCDFADKYLMDWLWWSYDKEEHSAQGILDNNGNPNEVMKTLSRAYPQKVAGLKPLFYIKISTVQSQKDNSTFYLEYICNEPYVFPTEIFIPGNVLYITTNTEHISEDHYTNGILQFYQKTSGKQTIEITWQHS